MNIYLATTIELDPGQFILNAVIIFSLIYGPFILIPLGLLLIGRLFFIKKRTKSAMIFAIGILSLGLILASLALYFHAQGKL